MNTDYLAIAANLARNQFAPVTPLRTGKQYVSLSFDCFTVEATFHLEGWSHPATEDSPAERPVPYVDECKVSCGSWHQIVPFELLSVDVQEQVLDVIANEDDV